MAELLAYCAVELRTVLALGAFAGLQTSEILALKWSNINLRSKFITVTEVGNDLKRRRVPILPNLGQWLSGLTVIKGAVWAAGTRSLSTAQRNNVTFINAMRSKSKPPFRWLEDGMRQSFATYYPIAFPANGRKHLDVPSSLAMQAEKWFCVVPKKTLWE
jgi:integrase